MGSKRKQLKLTLLFLLLSCIFAAAGFWFRAHPLFDEDGPTWHTELTAPAEPYAPYDAASLSVPAPTAAPTPAVPPSEPPAVDFPESPADPLIRFYTIERASVFTFSGLRNEKELENVLAALERTGSHATFFVTPEELEAYPAQVDAICRAGQHLGIGIMPGEDDTADTLLEAIRTQAEALRSRYGADYELFVRPASDMYHYALLQAAEAGGFRSLSQMKEAVPDNVSRITDPDEILPVIFFAYETVLQRGEIVHFQMGVFQHSDTLLSELIERIIEERCIYPIRAADEVAANTDCLYSFPLSAEQILPEVRDQIYPGHLDGLTWEESFQIIRDGYIGNRWIVPPDYFPGFSLPEAWQMDQTGFIQNDENYIFLTFDDWGTDINVDKLLSVLEKHNATTTFFVRSNYVHSNPNLLRAIAAAGHTIASHTYSHYTLSNEVTLDNYVELTDEEQKALEEDLVLSYNAMQDIIGDMVDADGKPSLGRLFRPPTLAVGKKGLETVFDCGFTHAVLGFQSTHDYSAVSALELAFDIRYYMVPGSIMVMHFSDNSKYTAEALDILLTEYETEGIGYRFVSLNKVLS